MRIRWGVPKDGQEKSQSSPGWFRRLFSPSHPPPVSAFAPAPEPPPLPKFDKRWIAFADARYFPAGRLCVHPNGHWHCEYLFDVYTDGSLRQMRIVVPETAVNVWEKKNGRRMPEAARLSLVKSTLESLLELNRCPSEQTITSDAIEAVTL